MIRQRGGKFCVCHHTGKVIKCFPTEKEAQDMHAAIMVNKLGIGREIIRKTGINRVWIKPTGKRKGHWRHVKPGKGEEPKKTGLKVKLADLIKTITTKMNAVYTKRDESIAKWEALTGKKYTGKKTPKVVGVRKPSTGSKKPSGPRKPQSVEAKVKAAERQRLEREIEKYQAEGDGLKAELNDVIGESKDKKVVEESDIKQTDTIVPMTKSNVKKILSFDEMGIDGGKNIKKTHLVEFKDSTKGIYKTTSPGSTFGEVSTYKVNDMVGWNVIPETVKGNFGEGSGSVQRWLDNGGVYDGGWAVGSVKGIKSEHIDGLSKIFVLDMILGNSDRHIQNVMIDKTNNTVIGIDNERIGGSHPKSDTTTTQLGLDALDDFKNGEETYGNEMIKWLQFNDEPMNKVFHDGVMKNIGNIIDSRDKIMEYFNNSKDIKMYDGQKLSKVIGDLNNNFDLIEKYYKENKS